MKLEYYISVKLLGDGKTLSKAIQNSIEVINIYSEQSNEDGEDEVDE